MHIIDKTTAEIDFSTRKINNNIVTHIKFMKLELINNVWVQDIMQIESRKQIINLPLHFKNTNNKLMINVFEINHQAIELVFESENIIFRRINKILKTLNIKFLLIIFVVLFLWNFI